MLELSGGKEYIQVKLFNEVEYDRVVTAQGMSILCYDPNIKDLLWQYTNSSIENVKVPAGHKVRVKGATITFSRPSGPNFRSAPVQSHDQRTM